MISCLIVLISLIAFSFSVNRLDSTCCNRFVLSFRSFETSMGSEGWLAKSSSVEIILMFVVVKVVVVVVYVGKDSGDVTDLSSPGSTTTTVIRGGK
ncbi:hypothetical protein BKA69DRAFT_1044218 [Paraphysoderma sedebokerense]|nr:hypothetical protein BKA69DRAFT_1044218 [Paraphysoderma sedebokerense]